MQLELYTVFFKSNMIFIEITWLLRQNDVIDRLKQHARIIKESG